MLFSSRFLHEFLVIILVQFTEETKLKQRAVLGAVAHACFLSTWGLEAGGSDTQGQLQPHSEFEGSLSWLRPSSLRI